MIRRGRRTRQRQIIAPPIVPTKALEQQLLRVYMRVVREWGRLIPLQVMPKYERTLGEVRDSVDDVDKELEDIGAALNRLVLTIGADLEDWVVRVEQWHRGRFGTLFTPAGVKLDTLLGPADVGTTLKSVLGENVALIRSLNDQMRNGISGQVFRGLTDRLPARDVARAIRKETGIAARRAELIAADQLQKLTGRLDQERQEQVGITKFQWQHSGKKYPRPEHVARNGIVYAWDSPVGKNDPPGRAIRCGCRARAVVELDDEALAEGQAAAAPLAPPASPAPPANTAARRADNDRRSRTDVLAWGERTGNERLVGYDERDGLLLPGSNGTRSQCNFTPEMQRLASDPNARLVVHHNHPSSASLSGEDMLLLSRNPGLSRVWAHGHNGSSYLVERGKKALTRRAFDAAHDVSYEQMFKLIRQRVMTSADGNLLQAHLRALILHDRGLIKYKAKLAGSSVEAWERNKTLLELIRTTAK